MLLSTMKKTQHHGKIFIQVIVEGSVDLLRVDC